MLDSIIQFISHIVSVIKNIFSGLHHLLEIIRDGFQAIDNWSSFIPAFLLPFMLVSVILTILLVVLKRANK